MGSTLQFKGGLYEVESTVQTKPVATKKASNFYLQTGEDKSGGGEETNTDEAVEQSLSQISGWLLGSYLNLGYVQNASGTRFPHRKMGIWTRSQSQSDNERRSLESS